MQAVWWSVWCWHAHFDVHRNPDFCHVQRRVLHCLRHEHATISRQLPDMGLNSINTGCSPDSPGLRPISEGVGSSGVGQWAYHHIIAWWCTLVKWKRSPSLVGAFAWTGFPVLENNKIRAASIALVLYTYSIFGRQMFLFWRLDGWFPLWDHICPSS